MVGFAHYAFFGRDIFLFKSKKPRLKTFKTAEEKKTKTGDALRRYCFWLLARRDYGREELLKKLKTYALDPDEAVRLADEMESKKYVDDKRVAQSIVRNEISKGCGPRKIQMTLKNKKIDVDGLDDSLKEVDWFQQAYDLKVRKFGEAVTKDQKEKARQIRFLTYRGFDLDVVFKVVGHENIAD